jgi:thioredoxin 1
MLELNDNSFAEEVYTSRKPVLIEFAAPWCDHCKSFEKKLNILTQQYENKIKFAKVNIDESYQLAAGFKINKLPTFILYKNGQPVSYLVGDISLATLKDVLDEEI